MIQAEKGHNSPKLEEKKFVLKWHLDNNMQDCVPMLMQLVLILDCTSWANTRVIGNHFGLNSGIQIFLRPNKCWDKKCLVKKYFGSKENMDPQILGSKNFWFKNVRSPKFWLNKISCLNLSCPDLTRPDLTCLDLTCPDFTCPDLT